MIEEFYVNNYKCLVDVRLPLTPIHVIIGQNDSGKTSLLEAMLALSRSVNEPIDQAFPGEWRDRELVYADAESPSIQFEARLGVEEGCPSSQVTYHLGVDFTRGTPVRGADEWYTNSQLMRIPGSAPTSTGVAGRGDHGTGTVGTISIGLPSNSDLPASTGSTLS